MSEVSPVKGRHLLMIATGQYADPDVWCDLTVDAETRVWADWLTDPGLGERAFTVVFEDLARSPTITRVNAMLEKRCDFDKDRDVLVCYITGHGEQHNGEHRLILATSEPGRPSSMLQTRQVLEWLKDGVNTALVVVDTCYAGDIATHLSSLDEDLPDGWIVIATASAHDQARLGVLTEAVREFADGGAADAAFAYLQFGELFKALSEALRDQRWKLLSTPLRWQDRPVCLPNRHYRPDVHERVVVEPARQDVALYTADLAPHWDRHSRGVADGSTAGVLFTGRDRLMRTLIDAARGEPGAVVVTGVAGCGKSAALSRLVTFSDPGFRARYATAIDVDAAAGAPRPRVGDVDLAVLAKGRVARGVLDVIGDRLGIDPVDGETLGETVARIHLARTGRGPATLVVDALDEAADPRGIVGTVLGPLLNPPGAPWLRLLVGVRGSAADPGAPPDGEEGLAAATIRALSAAAVDAAAAPYWTGADLAAYVVRLLRAPPDGGQPTPYAAAPEDEVGRLAAVVAQIAGTSYVLARLISDRLRRQTYVQDPGDPAWQAHARAGLAEIVEAELDTDYPDPDRRRVTRCLLTGASLARGRGAPRRHIWPALAAAVDPTARRYTDADIAALLDEHVGGYLVRDVAENATVYRPFHDALGAALTGTIDSATRHRITTGLVDVFTVTRTHRLVVPPVEYLRRHLVEHAADSGDLNRLIRDPEVLTWTDPDHLLPLLEQLSEPDAQAIGRIYRTIAHTLRHRDGPPDTFPLHLRVLQSGLRPLADQLAAATPGWLGRVRWATSRRDSDHQRIGTPGPIADAAVATLPDGTPVVVFCGDDATVRVWRLADGAPLGEPLRGHEYAVNSLAVGALPDGTPVIVSGSADHTVRVWRLADGVPLGEPLRGHEYAVNSVAVGALPDGTPVIVSGSADHTVRVWRLGDGVPLGPPLRHDAAVGCVAVGALPDGTPVIVSGSGDQTVRVWRLADGAPVAELPGHSDLVTCLAVGALPDGTPVIVSGSGDQTVRMWRLADGAPIGEPLRGHSDLVTCVAVGALPDGTPVIVSGSWDRTVRVWRLADGAPIGEPLRGHSDLVTCVAVGALPDGTPVIVSGSSDCTVRVWRRLADSAVRGYPPRAHSDTVSSVALAALPDGTSIIVSGSYDRTARKWQLVDGAPLAPPIRCDFRQVTSVAAGTLPDGTPVIVSGNKNDTVQVSRLADGVPLGTPLRGHDSAVTSVAVGALPDGTPVIVSASMDHTLRIWRLGDGAALRKPLRGHDGAVYSVALGKLPDGTPVIVSGGGDDTVRVWRLADGAPLGPRLSGHDAAVSCVAVGALPDGTPVIVSGGDQTLRVWRLADGAPIGKP